MELSDKTNIANLAQTDIAESSWMQGIAIPVLDIGEHSMDAHSMYGEASPQEMVFLQNALETDDDDATGAAYSDISLTTTSSDMPAHFVSEISHTGIDFMRIDTGSQPFPVSKEGVSLLERNSPLVMYSTRQTHAFHAEMMQTFQILGYKAYRLVPGIGCLSPVHINDDDMYDSNLYCCKPDRAARLSARGLLLRRDIDMTVGIRTAPDLWIDDLQHYPYAIQLLPLWAQFIEKNGMDTLWLVHQEALSSYAVSRLNQLPPQDRFQALYWSYLLIEDIVREAATFSRLMTLARITSDLGYWGRTSDVIERLLRMLDASEDVSVNEPFLAISERFERLDPKLAIGDWCLASFIEARQTGL